MQSESQIHLASNASLQKARKVETFYLTVIREQYKNGGTGDTLCVVGLYETEQLAKTAGLLERQRRAATPYMSGGKPEVIKMKLNEGRWPIDIQSVDYLVNL